MSTRACTHGLRSEQQEDSSHERQQRIGSLDRRVEHVHASKVESGREIGPERGSSAEENLPPVLLVGLQLRSLVVHLRQQRHVRHAGADELAHQSVERQLHEAHDGTRKLQGTDLRAAYHRGPGARGEGHGRGLADVLAPGSEELDDEDDDVHEDGEADRQNAIVPTSQLHHGLRVLALLGGQLLDV